MFSRRAVRLILLQMIACSFVYGQMEIGQITGTITDPSGASVANARGFGWSGGMDLIQQEHFTLAGQLDIQNGPIAISLTTGETLFREPISDTLG